MNVLHINTSDVTGGAAKAAFRLHNGLRELGIESSLFVQDKRTDHVTVIGPETKFSRFWSLVRPTVDRVPSAFYSKKSPFHFHSQWLPGKTIKMINRINPDIINLHWICDGFVSIREISRIRQPIVWTLHDSWPFTGGCHLPFSCTKYEETCGKCPHLGSRYSADLSRLTWRRKYNHWKHISVQIISPSQWMFKRAGRSSLFQKNPVKTIPNGLDLNIYKPLDPETAKDAWKLPRTQKTILFGAANALNDRVKGFIFLLPALRTLNSSFTQGDISVCVFGASAPKTRLDAGFEIHYKGILHDDTSLALLYSAADVFVMPSKQENLPYTVMEAMACGTPCVAFDVGGISDLIDHKINGYLARPFDTNDLANGLAWVLENESRRRQLSRKAREKVEQNFDIRRIAGKYIELYESVIR